MMTANSGQQPPQKRAAKRKGAALPARPAGALQPIGKRKAKTKAKPEVEPAKRIAGVGTAKAAVIDSSMVTLKSLSVGNGGLVIKVTESQVASIRQLGDSL